MMACLALARRLCLSQAVHNKFRSAVSRRMLHLSSCLYADPTRIVMPALSPTMTTGTIVKWEKREGDLIQPGDILCEIQTDKAVVGFEIEETGILAKICMPDDATDIEVGQLIALMVDEDVTDWKNVEIPPLIDDQKQQPIISADSQEESEARKEHNVGPAVRHLLLAHGFNEDDVAASGPHGRLTKGDVLQHIASGSPGITKATEPAASQEEVNLESVAAIASIDSQNFTDIALTNMRKTIARRLSQSKKEVPHEYCTIRNCVDEILKIRQSWKEANRPASSVNDFIVKAAAMALKKVPQVNSSWNVGEERAQALPNVDIAVAVATPDGLITPIIKETDTLSIDQISTTIREMAQRGKHGKLKLDEISGGSFTISNLGMYGIKEFTAIINPPQASVMAVGAAQRVFSKRQLAQNIVTTTLSYDARVFQHDTAAHFLNVFRTFLENPLLVLSQEDFQTLT